MKIGYARVSASEQNAQLQRDALYAVGCEQIYEEKTAVSKTERPELQLCLKSLAEGDELIVWKLDRLGRSLQHLIEIISDLESRKVGFKSVTENIDTTNSTGALIFHLFGSLAEFERGLLRERVKAGLAAAKNKGVKFGRPNALSEKDKEIALAMFNSGETKIAIARHFNVTRQTIYTLLKSHEA